MDTGIAQLYRVEGRSCYLLMGMKDGRIDIYEERGKGTGKIEKAGGLGQIPGATQGGLHRASRNHCETGIFARIIHTPTGDRLFIHTHEKGQIIIHIALIEAGKLVSSDFILSSTTGLGGIKAIQLLPGR